MTSVPRAVSELQHPLSRSFEDVAELYERTRPSYPSKAVDWLLDQLRVDAYATVLDLGAGTGKLTRALLGRCARVIAVEPGPEMLAQLQRAVPEAEALLGAAEAIPLPDDSVDAVVCGQAFHWFRADEALSEIGRVLRDGGGLGLIWNMRHPDDLIQNEITKLLDPLVPPGRADKKSSVESLVDSALRGREVFSAVFAFDDRLDADGLVARIGSTSYVAAASEEARNELNAALRALVSARGGNIPFRYLTDAHVTFNVV
jgi:ubiquinone/menaquinone biosynthesis C-methylase UbiE